ncbi:MAG: PstS family phosphate ABC transporter substrate-binding protein [Acidobacteria bacterium]|nr:PstS family phosphate ABC transporter substrate-binding protein [Acidobacteriota bacterium]
MKFTSIATTIAVLGFAGTTFAQAVKVDPAIPAYTSTQGVSGNLKSVGSDTMNNEMTLWAEGFRKLYRNVKVEIEGKGSSTAPPALTAGTSHFGPMSRAMKADEVDKFEKKYGYKPTEIRTSVDVLAVYVHKDNPIAGLTLQQVDAIFSKTRRGGAKKDIKTWGDLGLTGEWKDKPISLYGRNSASGTYGFFKENALFKGDYKDSVKEQPGSSSVVQGVASDRYGIGYSGIGYKTADVKAVPLAAKGAKFFEANAENGYQGLYPLSRYLYLYVNRAPGKPLDPVRAEFLKYMLSQEGQEAVVKDGYYPLPNKIVMEERQKLGIN